MNNSTGPAGRAVARCSRAQALTELASGGMDAGARREKSDE